MLSSDDMKLEEEIKSRFRNDRHKAGVNLIYTANWYAAQLNCTFKRYDMTAPQYNVLRILRGAHPKAVSLKYIRERMLDKMSDVSRIVEKLREKQWLVRHECPEDRRNVDILITDHGMNLLAVMDQEMIPMERIFTGWTDEEIQQFNILLDKLREGRTGHEMPNCDGMLEA